MTTTTSAPRRHPARHETARSETAARTPETRSLTSAKGGRIPIAEETGIIIDLGSLVLRRACGQLAQWQRTDRRCSALRMAVDVSARQLVHPEFFDTVRAVVSDLDGSPEVLTLEITESTLMESAGPAMAAIAALKGAFGVSITIDDFGTGYSSLSYLTRLPIDGLKVDRSFVSGLGGADAQDTAVVRAVLSLGDNLGLRLTAEGVETDEQADHLLRLNCQYAQGYLRRAPHRRREHRVAGRRPHRRQEPSCDRILSSAGPRMVSAPRPPEPRPRHRQEKAVLRGWS